MPNKRLARVQVSTESVWATSSGPVTAKLMGITDMSLKLVDEVENIAPIGTLGPGTVNAHLAQHAEGSISFLPTYEDSLYYLHSMYGNTGTTSTSTSAGIGPFVYNYTAPHQTAPTAVPYFMEYGTTDANYSAEGILVNKINIKGTAGKYWEGTADLVGKSISNATSTDGLTTLIERTVTPIMMSDTKLYIDPMSTSTAFGLTEIAANLIDFDFNADSKIHLKQFNGSISPGNYGYGQWEGSLKTTLEFTSTSKAYITSLLSTSYTPVTKLIRLKATDPSTSTGVQTFTIDMGGVLTDGVELFGDRDGNMTLELNWAGAFSTLINTWNRVIVESHSSKLPSS